MNIETDIACGANMTTVFQFLAQILGVAHVSVLPGKKLTGVFTVNLPHVSTRYLDIDFIWFH